MLKDEREAYEEFFKAFGIQLKFGIYNDYGAHKETLRDLLIFRSSNEKKYVTLKEYVSRMKEGQDSIYYACGETDEKIDMLPQTDAGKDKGYEILYLTENVDEFALKMLAEYDGKKFVNICDNDLNLDSEDEKKALEEENTAAKDMFEAMKESLGDKINAVRFTNKLKDHPVCLTSEGGISLEMEKVLNSMPGAEQNKVKAQLVRWGTFPQLHTILITYHFLSSHFPGMIKEQSRDAEQNFNCFFFFIFSSPLISFIRKPQVVPAAFVFPRARISGASRRGAGSPV